MKRWPLRVKIALWSALVVALALLVSSVATALHFYHEDVEMLDHLLDREKRGVFAELKRLPSNFTITQERLEKRLPAAYKERHVEVLHGGRIVYRSDNAGEEIYGALNQPPGFYTMPGERKARLVVADRDEWQVRVAFETRDVRNSMSELLRGFALASPALLLITAAGGWWISQKALAPIDKVTKAAEEITAAHFERRLPVPPNQDEVHRLTLVLNEMIGRLENSFRQAKHFSADTSHELRTPLAVIHAGLESMLTSEELTPSQERQLLDLLDATTQLSSLSEKLLLLSRADAGHLDFECCPCDLAAMLREAIDEASIFADEAEIAIRPELPAEINVTGDSARLMQVLRNLLENAVKYNRPGGYVAVRLREDGEWARLQITNTGEGIAPHHAARIFDRFYRAETHRGSPGHGLGLSISREIVRAHGGELWLESHATDQLTFVATFRMAMTEVSSV